MQAIHETNVTYPLIIGYRRTSTNRQYDGFVSQKSAIEDYAEKHNLTIDVWFGDFGISGNKVNIQDRPGYADLADCCDRLDLVAGENKHSAAKKIALDILNERKSIHLNELERLLIEKDNCKINISNPEKEYSASNKIARIDNKVKTLNEAIKDIDNQISGLKTKRHIQSGNLHFKPLILTTSINRICREEQLLNNFVEIQCLCSQAELISIETQDNISKILKDRLDIAMEFSKIYSQLNSNMHYDSDMTWEKNVELLLDEFKDDVFKKMVIENFYLKISDMDKKLFRLCYNM